MVRKLHTNFKNWIKRAPDRKIYIEVITALLTVPVMITVLITNLNNLSSKKEEHSTPAPQPKQEIIIKEVPSGDSAPQAGASAKQLTPDTCKKEVGPVTISYPREGQAVDENPLNIIVNYDDDTYCSVVWSYRINNGSWSEYNSSSISFYDMPSGEKKLDLRIQSTVSQDQEMISRTFTYTNTSTPVATQSAE